MKICVTCVFLNFLQKKSLDKHEKDTCKGIEYNIKEDASEEELKKQNF